MKSAAKKLQALEAKIAKEKGRFLLFALFLREDAPNVWDLVLSAPWVEKDKAASIRYVADTLKSVLSRKELTHLSRIVIIDTNNPALTKMQSGMEVEHGLIDIQQSNFFGLQIKHAYIITSRRETP